MSKISKPLVSVIIPMYNTGNACLNLLEVLQESTYKNVETICIDDGSTDNSYAVIEKYAKKHKNIVLKKQKNAGASAARNAGLKLAKGEWVSFIDSDDLVDKTFIEKLVDAYKGDIIIANVALLYKRLATGVDHEDFMKDLRTRKSSEGIKEYIVYSMLQDGRMYGVVNKLFRRDIVEENKLRFDTSLNFAEDTKFFLGYVDAAMKYYPEDAKVKSIYEPLYIYNYGTETSTVAKSSLDWKNWKKSYANLSAWAKDCNTLTMKWRKILLWCRWRISHALSVARANMAFSEKIKYLNIFELIIASLLVRLRS